MFSTFKEYLAESKKTYGFRVKIAGDIPKQFESNLKSALAAYDCTKVHGVSRTPIQESPLDFPEVKNMEVHTFDIDCNYPTTSPMIRDIIGEKLKISQSLIKVRTPGEQREIEMNQAFMQVPGEGDSLLEKEYDKDAEGQKLVGEAHVSSFLKELSKISADRKAQIVKTEATEKTDKSEPDFEVKKSSSALKGLTGNPDPRKGK